MTLLFSAMDQGEPLKLFFMLYAKGALVKVNRQKRSVLPMLYVSFSDLHYRVSVGTCKHSFLLTYLGAPIVKGKYKTTHLMTISRKCRNV